MNALWSCEVCNELVIGGDKISRSCADYTYLWHGENVFRGEPGVVVVSLGRAFLK
ncbi:hypothetical protein YC2023_113280 [Brassica napus]